MGFFPSGAWAFAFRPSGDVVTPDYLRASRSPTALGIAITKLKIRTGKRFRSDQNEVAFRPVSIAPCRIEYQLKSEATAVMVVETNTPVFKFGVPLKT